MDWAASRDLGPLRAIPGPWAFRSVVPKFLDAWLGALLSSPGLKEVPPHR